MGSGIYALQLGAVTALHGLESRVGSLYIGQGELVGGTLQVAAEALDAVVALVKTRAQHTAQAQVTTVNVKVFVKLGESLGIQLAVAHVAQTVVAIFGGIERVGRGKEFLLVFIAALVILHTARDVEPRGDAPVERDSRLVALLVVDEALALGFPIGVLHRDIIVIGPILHREVAARVIALVVAQLGEVVTGGEQIDRHQRIVVLALADHVLLLDGGEHVTQVERHAVVEETGGVAHAHVVAVVVVAVDDSVGIGGTERQIGLVLFGTGAQAHRVGDIGARLEEVGGTVIAGGCQFLTPTEVTARLARSVLVLEAGQYEGLGELETTVVGDIYPACTTTLGGNDDDAVGGIGTVEGRRRGARQGADALDVIGVDVTGGVTRLAGSGKDAFRLLAGEVLHGDAVHDIQHVVVAIDRLGSAHYHAAAAARTRRAGIDGHTGHLARERVDEVGIRHPRQGIAFDLLHVVGQRLGLFLDTEGGHDNLTEVKSCRRFHCNRHVRAIHPHIARLITHITYGQGSTRGRTDAESPIEIGGSSHNGALDTDGSSDHGLAVLVKHLSRHRRGLYCAALHL